MAWFLRLVGEINGLFVILNDYHKTLGLEERFLAALEAKSEIKLQPPVETTRIVVVGLSAVIRISIIAVVDRHISVGTAHTDILIINVLIRVGINRIAGPVPVAALIPVYIVVPVLILVTDLAGDVAGILAGGGVIDALFLSVGRSDGRGVFVFFLVVASRNSQSYDSNHNQKTQCASHVTSSSHKASPIDSVGFTPTFVPRSPVDSVDLDCKKFRLITFFGDKNRHNCRFLSGADEQGLMG